MNSPNGATELVNLQFDVAPPSASADMNGIESAVIGGIIVALISF